MIVESSIADTSADIGRLTQSEKLLTRISYSRPNDWLPHYYIALENIRMAELILEEGKAINSNYFSNAFEHLEKADSLNRGNAEIKILKAYWAAAKNDSVLIEQLNAEMLLLIPNPRALYVLVLFSNRLAQYNFRDKYLDAILKLCPLEFPEGSFNPKWGCFSAEKLKQKWM